MTRAVSIPNPFLFFRSIFLSKKACHVEGNNDSRSGRSNRGSFGTLKGEIGPIHTLKKDKSGAVESGTLEGLVHFLIHGFGEEKP